MSGTVEGTALPLATTSDLWQVEAIGLGETPRLRQGKATPLGEVIYTTGCILRSRRKDGSVTADKSASISVIEPAAIYEIGTVFRAEGRIYVQPWMTDGSMARSQLSITVERLVPVGAGVPANGRGKAEAASAS